MKSKIKIFITTLIMMCQVFTCTVYANTADDVDNAISGIISFYAGSDSEEAINSWITGDLSANAGNGSEWNIISIAKYQDIALNSHNFSPYLNALPSNISDKLTPTARERISLAMIAAGDTSNPFIQETIDTSIGAQGIMSLIWGLHLLNNVNNSNSITATELISQIIELQHPDGGFSIMGDYGDVDVTAMAVTAMAPYFDKKSYEDITYSINLALDFLKTKQNENGTFSSYGVENAESTAQVITALSSLGLDAKSHKLKSETSVLDALLTFRLENGSFCHKLGDSSNTIATQQALYSLIAYKLYLENKGQLFVFSINSGDAVSPTPQVSDSQGSESQASPSSHQPTNTDIGDTNSQTSESVNATSLNDSNINIKALLIVALSFIWLVSVIIMLIKKKRSIKSYAFPTFLVAILITIITLSRIETGDSYYNNNQNNTSQTVGTILLSIDCATTLDNENQTDNSYFPSDGYLAKNISCPIYDDSTAFSVLVDYCKDNKIQLDFTGSASSPYVRGINNLYEMDYGPLSGWMYHVNQDEPSVSAGQFNLHDGDVLEWRYTCETGKDLISSK